MTAPKKPRPAVPAKAKASDRTAAAPSPAEPPRIFQIGNFGPEHSTENHLLRALEANGAEVWFFQENDHGAFRAVTEQLGESPTFVLWTRTGWPWAQIYAGGANEAHAEQRRMLRLCRTQDVPVVGYHLDIWWGLARERDVTTEPFFEVDLLVTADGGHDSAWEMEGINHLWMPPGVSRGECQVGTPREEFRSRLAFVGSHDGGYHPEHRHRAELIDWLRRHFRRDCAFWPQPGQPAVRGADLQDLYASVDVVIGDSCFAGQNLARYVSDRLPETTGRGGLLLHPRVEGITDGHGWEFGPTWTEGEHLFCWDAGNWEELGASIGAILATPRDELQVIRDAAQAHVQEHHSYERRMQQLVVVLRRSGLLRD